MRKSIAALVAAAILPAGGALADGVKVTASFAGEPPAMPELDRKSDVVCAKVKMKDEEVLVTGGKLQNVLVRVTKGAQPEAGQGEVFIGQKDCMFRPRVQGAVAGQTVKVNSEDPTLHNVHTYIKERTLFNRAQPPGAPAIAYTIKAKDKNSVIRVKCDVHAWMAAFVVVGDNPHFAVTDERGVAALDKLPPGTYAIEAWHERYGVKTAEVAVEAGKTAEIGFEYTGKEPRPAP